jgi:glycosyltransferase involved in cell wall biosynthesis
LHTEGISNALLEAVLNGMAVISTNVGAAPEMIADGRSGLLVDVADTAGLVEALDRLIDDGGLRRSMGTEASRTVAEHYGIGPVVDRMEAAYEAILPAVRR